MNQFTSIDVNKSNKMTGKIKQKNKEMGLLIISFLTQWREKPD